MGTTSSKTNVLPVKMPHHDSVLNNSFHQALVSLKESNRQGIERDMNDVKAGSLEEEITEITSPGLGSAFYDPEGGKQVERKDPMTGQMDPLSRLLPIEKTSTKPPRIPRQADQIMRETESIKKEALQEQTQSALHDFLLPLGSTPHITLTNETSNLPFLSADPSSHILSQYMHPGLSLRLNVPKYGRWTGVWSQTSKEDGYLQGRGLSNVDDASRSELPILHLLNPRSQISTGTAVGMSVDPFRGGESYLGGSVDVSCGDMIKTTDINVKLEVGCPLRKTVSDGPNSVFGRMTVENEGNLMSIQAQVPLRDSVQPDVSLCAFFNTQPIRASIAHSQESTIASLSHAWASDTDSLTNDGVIRRSFGWALRTKTLSKTGETNVQLGAACQVNPNIGLKAVYDSSGNSLTAAVVGKQWSRPQITFSLLSGYDFQNKRMRWPGVAIEFGSFD